MALPRILKWVIWVVGTVTALLIVVGVLLSWLFFGLVGEPSKDEVARVISPNGKIDAVLVETNGGATTSFGYEVYILEHGAQPSGSPAVFLYGAIRNQSAYGSNLKWESPNLLAVEFLSAKSKDISRSSVSIDGQSVQLAVRDGVADPTAPGGGMLYNLRGRPGDPKGH